MFRIIAFMITGIAIGYRYKDKKITQKTEMTIFLTILSLLFILGLSVGTNEAIINNLYDYGSQAIILAVFGLAGSIVSSWLVYIILFKKGDNQ